MIDIDKVIILENEEEYLVLDKVNYENIEYYYIAKLNESRTDIENNYKLVTIIESSGNKVISEVTKPPCVRPPARCRTAPATWTWQYRSATAPPDNPAPQSLHCGGCRRISVRGCPDRQSANPPRRSFLA